MGEGDGSVSQPKVMMAKSAHTSVSRSGHPTIKEKVVAGI